MFELKKNDFTSIECEKLVIAGILKYPEIYFDLCLILKPEDFGASRINSVIWSIYGDLLSKNDKIDYRLTAIKLEELKINFNLGDVTILDYCEALFYLSGVNKENIQQFAYELKKNNGKKILAQAGLEVANKMLDIKDDLTYPEIVSVADSIFNTKINIFENGGIEQPIDIFENLENEIESIGNDQVDNSVFCPFPRLKKLYGDFTPGDLYFWIARPKQGKSTFLMNTAFQCSVSLDNPTKVLYLDTEMETYRVKYRILSAISGVNEYYIRTGKWRNNQEMMEKIKAVWPLVKLYTGNFHHLYVGNADTEELCSIIRRWHKKNIPNDNSVRGLIAYDYFKLGSDINKISGNMRPDLLVGWRVDRIKKLMTELQLPMITAGQSNRFNEGRKSDNDRINDGSVVGLSDQISQFSSAIHLFNKITQEEVQELDANFGIRPTHKIIPLYTRSQGEEAQGFNDLIKIEDGDGKVSWRENVIYYNIDSFAVTELTDLATLVKDRKNYKISDNEQADGDLL